MRDHKGNILAVQSYGYILGPEDMGPGAVGSRARLLYAAMLVGAGQIKRKNLLAVFPQGRKPGESNEDHFLGHQMELYLRSRPEMDGVEFRSSPQGWTTFRNILDTYHLAEQAGYGEGHIHWVTDPVHLRRVKMVVGRVQSRRWTSSFYAATFHRMTWWERLIREPGARLKYRHLLWANGY